MKPLKKKRRVVASCPPTAKQIQRQSTPSSFQYNAALTKPNAGASLKAYVRSDAFPTSGPGAAEYLENRSAILEAIEIADERIKVALTEEPDCIDGWELQSGQHVRQLHGDADVVWEKLSGGDEEYDEIPLGDYMACCAVRLGKLEELVALKLELTPADARAWINQNLARLLEARVNKPSIRKLSSAEALEQAERLDRRAE